MFITMTAENAFNNVTFGGLYGLDGVLSIGEEYVFTDFKAKGIVLCAEYLAFGDVEPQFFTLADPTTSPAYFDNAWKSELGKLLENYDDKHVTVEISAQNMPLMGGYIVVRLIDHKEDW